jgi:type II secretory pathway pseudopilin PulG
MSKSDGKGTGSSVVLLAALAGGGCLLLVFVVGILAAIAVPAFIGYTARAKSQEARAHIEALFAGVAGYYEAERVGPDGSLLSRELPPSAARTPAVPPCGTRAPWPSEAPGEWRALRFHPSDPLYYAYEYERGPDGRSFVIRAAGDLDCDGHQSLFELRGGIDDHGGVYREPYLHVADEHE